LKYGDGDVSGGQQCVSAEVTTVRFLSLVTRWFALSSEGPFEFQIPWFPETDGIGYEVRDASILLSDVTGMTARAVAPIRRLCREKGRRLVIVAPQPHESLIDLSRRGDILAIRATDLTNQDKFDLLEDLAVVSSGALLSKDFGFGLSRLTVPQTIENKDVTEHGVLLPGMGCDEVSFSDLGTAEKVTANDSGSTFRWEVLTRKQAREIQYYVDYLRRNDVTLGCCERLRRLGNEGPYPASIPEIPNLGPSDIELPFGLASRYLINDPKFARCVLENPYVAVFAGALDRADVVIELLGCVVRKAAPLLLIAPSVSDEVLAVFVVNRLRGTIQCAIAVSRQGNAKSMLTEPADRIGASAIDPAEVDTNDLRAPACIEACGRVRRVVLLSQMTCLLS